MKVKTSTITLEISIDEFIAIRDFIGNSSNRERVETHGITEQQSDLLDDLYTQMSVLLKEKS